MAQEIRVGPHTTQLGGGSSGEPSGASAHKDNCPPAMYARRVHGWLLERLAEGDRVNRSDPTFRIAPDLIADLMGDQTTQLYKTAASRKVVLNQTRKAINTHASMLSDVKPLWEWRTQNQNFKQHSKAYNDQLTVWWLQSCADRELTDAVRYAGTIGSSDVLFEYDKNYNGGDSRLTARDWRDTLPIRPEKTVSLQEWEGVIICQSHSAAKLRSTFPGVDPRIFEGGEASGVGAFTRFRRLTRVETQAPGTLAGLRGMRPDQQRYDAVAAAAAPVMLYRAFFRDRAINTTAHRVLMGTMGTNWCYWVEPGEPLYPRGRCCLFTGTGLVYDGPNPYWSGMWPVSRLSLQRWPWLMVGMPLAFDLRELAQAINITTNDLLTSLSQWIHRGSIWGKNAPESVRQTFDPTVPNWRLKINQQVGTGFSLQDGPNIPAWAFQLLSLLFSKWDELSGTANLAQLLTLRQSPAADTLDKYMEAMTPEIRLEAREIEYFLREIAQMWIFNASQFYSPERRKMILGDAGQVLADMDYDPGTIIPALRQGSQGYVPELDEGLPRDQRARYFLGQFGFYVAPNSILALHDQQRKMLYMQLARQGYLDIWSLLEMLEVPNVGTPPLVLLPVQMSESELKALPPSPPQVDPATGMPGPPGPPQPPMEYRLPVTISERLVAQQQMGIGQTVSAAGRKASGQEPPQMKQRSDGSTTITESK